MKRINWYCLLATLGLFTWAHAYLAHVGVGFEERLVASTLFILATGASMLVPKEAPHAD